MMTKTEVKNVLQLQTKELGRFPTIDEFSKALALKPSQAEQVLSILAGDGFLRKNDDNTYQLVNKERKVSGAVSGVDKPLEAEPEIEIKEPEKVESLPDTTEVVTSETVEHFTQTEEPESGPFNAEDIKNATETLLALEPPTPPAHFWKDILKEAHIKADKWRNRFKRKPKPPVRKKQQSTTGVISFIRTVMAIVSIGAAVISMYYTSRFTLELFPWEPLAYLLSAIMVGFNVMAFELILLFGTKQATDHWFRWPAAIAFFLLWSIVGGFSITATVAGQYNHHATATTKAAMDSGSPKVLAVKYTNILNRKRLYEKQIKDTQAQNDVLNKKQDKIKNDPEQAVLFQQNSWTITANNNKIATATVQYDEAVKEETAILKAHPEVVAMQQTEAGAEVPDFYGWLARVFGKSRDVIQFWTSLMPAVFVDLIAPIAGAAALFLRGKK